MTKKNKDIYCVDYKIRVPENNAYNLERLSKAIVATESDKYVKELLENQLSKYYLDNENAELFMNSPKASGYKTSEDGVVMLNYCRHCYLSENKDDEFGSDSNKVILVSGFKKEYNSSVLPAVVSACDFGRAQEMLLEKFPQGKFYNDKTGAYFYESDFDVNTQGILLVSNLFYSKPKNNKKKKK